MGKRKRTKKNKVEIEIEKLQLIADYYQFPIAAFFTSLKSWRKIKKEKNTRLKFFAQRSALLEQIIELIENAKKNGIL